MDIKMQDISLSKSRVNDDILAATTSKEWDETKPTENGEKSKMSKDKKSRKMMAGFPSDSPNIDSVPEKSTKVSEKVKAKEIFGSNTIKGAVLNLILKNIFNKHSQENGNPISNKKFRKLMRTSYNTLQMEIVLQAIKELTMKKGVGANVEEIHKYTNENFGRLVTLIIKREVEELVKMGVLEHHGGAGDLASYGITEKCIGNLLY